MQSAVLQLKSDQSADQRIRTYFPLVANRKPVQHLSDTAITKPSGGTTQEKGALEPKLH